MISVVMPCYNCEKALDRAIRSLRAQTIADWELLAVDDGSARWDGRRAGRVGA
ncbi:MAG: glycosyltransferase [Christensenellales bacterium]